ncbi:MAG: discoidin domain-containing protein, partial [Armatimonadetes bacterium]|nr:discoidin domain-containing protein [Armatimonadota bacterium]
MTRCCIAGIAAALAVAASARPISPDIDPPGEPFCYYSRPSTVLGVADGPEGTQVTPEGWLWTGWAELMFFIGPHYQPVRQRLHTLLDGYIPVVEYRYRHAEIEARFTMFGATLDGKPESNLINFVRVRLRNVSDKQATAHFAVAIRGVGPFCCTRMRRSYNAIRATYHFGPFYAARDDSLIYVFPTSPRPQLFVAPGTAGEGPIQARDEFITERAPVLMAAYEIELPPAQEAALDFKMPYVPVKLSDRETCAAIRDAEFDAYFRQTVNWWREYLGQGMQISLPESKVVNTYLASVAYDAIARDKIGEDYVPKVNEFQYDAFWVRDGSYIVSAFDRVGRHEWARQGLDYFLKQEQADGIIYQPPQYDGFGQTLWAFGEHWRVTRDIEWARRVYPAIARHVRGVFDKCRTDPLGLIPKAPPYDNEAINGHYTGHSLWFAIGLRDAIAIATALGEDADAREFRRLYDEYWTKFIAILDKITADTGGYVPPGLDAGPGCDWGNLLLTYPRGGDPAVGNFQPTDNRVTATVNAVRGKKYAEGIMTYGPGLKPGSLHLYLTAKITENLITQNRQRETLEDFYSMLVHTSSAHAGYEFGIKPWDNRDPGGNLPPHGWFAAKYILLLRDMLVYEWAGDLHLLAVLSPAWVKPGSTLAVRNAPTDFGELSLTAGFAAESMELQIEPRWRQAPRRLIVHIPWFMEGLSALADGNAVHIENAPFGQGQVLSVPPSTASLVVRWRRIEDPTMSYDAAVEEWKAENRKRFEEYVAKGGQPEPLWPERDLPMSREARQRMWAQMEAQYGIAVGCAATASHSEPGHTPDAAVDGSVSREVYWGATPYPAWWQVDLGKARCIERVRVVTYWGDGRYYRYKVLVSE